MVWAHITTAIQQVLWDCTLPFLRTMGSFGVFYGANIFGEVTYQINKPPALDAAEQDFVSINGHGSSPPYSTNPNFWATSLVIGDRNYWIDSASGKTWVPGWVQNYAQSADPSDDTVTDYGVYGGAAQANGQIAEGFRLPIQAQVRADDAGAFTYTNQAGPDPGGYYGGCVSAAPDGATPTGLYVVATSRRLGGIQHLWNPIIHVVGSVCTVGSPYYYEWPRVSAANLTDPYHPSSVLRPSWTHLHSDPGHPDFATWHAHGTTPGGSMDYTYSGEMPFLTFSGGPHTIFRNGGAYYALAGGAYYLDADAVANTSHATSTLGVWKASGSPIIPESWTLYKVLSPYNLLLAAGSADFNRDFGWVVQPDDVNHRRISNQLEQWGGSTYFTMPLGFTDSAGWLPPTKTTVWVMDASGSITPSLNLPPPGTGNYIYFGSMQQLDGQLYAWIYEATDTNGAAATKVFTVYQKGGSGWSVASRSTVSLGVTDFPVTSFANWRTAVWDCIAAAGGDELLWILAGPSNTTAVLRWKPSLNQWKVCDWPPDQHHSSPTATHLYYVGNPPA